MGAILTAITWVLIFANVGLSIFLMIHTRRVRQCFTEAQEFRRAALEARDAYDEQSVHLGKLLAALPKGASGRLVLIEHADFDEAEPDGKPH